MRDPFEAGELTLLRSQPHRTTLHLAVHKPRQIFACRLNGAPTAGEAVLELTYDGAVGAFADVEEGMTLWVSSSGFYERDKGWLRIRLAATGNTLFVAEAGDTLVNFEDDDYLTVVEDYRIASKYPRYTEADPPQWFMDYEIAYSDQNELFGPQAVMGPAAIGFLDGGSVDLSFYGSRSKAHTPGSTFGGFLWTFPDATTDINQGTVLVPVVWTENVAYPDGRWVSFRVTDSDGKTHTGRRLTFIFERTGGDVPYEAIVLGTMDGGWEAGGYKARIRALGVADITEFPQGAHVVIFEEAVYGGTEGSIGGNYGYRQNVVLEGWIQEGSIVQDSETGWVEFEIVTSGDLMKRLQAYPVALNHVDGAPSSWLEVKDLTLDLAAFHVLRWRSTVLDVIDVHFADNTGDVGGNTIAFQDLEAATLYDQLRKNYAEAGLGHVASDFQSAIYMQQDAQVAEVRWPQELFDLEKTDRIDELEVTERHHEPISQFIIYGASLTGEPLGASAPGDPFGYEGEVEEIPFGLALTDQNEVNAWAGNLRAERNNPYPRVTVQMAGYWRIDAVPQSYVLLSTIAADTKRGIVWTNKRMLVREYRVRYDAVKGSAQTELTLEPETVGVSGSAIIFPDPEPPEPVPPIPIPPQPPPLPDPPETIWCWGVATANTGFGLDIVRTKDMEAGTVVWESVRNAAIGVGESIRIFALDPFNPSTRGYLVTNGGIYYSTNLNAAVAANVVWVNSLDLADMRTLIGEVTAKFCDTTDGMNVGFLATTFADQGFIVSGAVRGPFGAGNNEFELWVLWTENITLGMAGWNFKKITDGFTVTSQGGECDVFISQHDKNIIFFIYGIEFPATAQRDTLLHYTLDGPNGTWASDRQIPHQAFEHIQLHCVRMPMFRDPTNQEMFAIERRAGSHAWRSDDQGITWTALEQPDYDTSPPFVSVLAGGAGDGGNTGREGLEESWTEAEPFWFAAGRAGSSNDSGVMRWSEDAQVWITVVIDAANEETYWGFGFGVWQYDHNFQFMAQFNNATLIRTTDAWTAIIIDWSGNIALFCGAAGKLRYIQPVWVPVA